MIYLPLFIGAALVLGLGLYGIMAMSSKSSRTEEYEDMVERARNAVSRGGL